jgi:hypothetical protein
MKDYEAKIPKETNCKNCIHFQDRQNGINGNCRRFPPMMPNNDFPVVRYDLVCGEHSYKVEWIEK